MHWLKSVAVTLYVPGPGIITVVALPKPLDQLYLIGAVPPFG